VNIYSQVIDGAKRDAAQHVGGGVVAEPVPP